MNGAKTLKMNHKFFPSLATPEVFSYLVHARSRVSDSFRGVYPPSDICFNIDYILQELDLCGSLIFGWRL
jgi:hypothetical protein